MGLRGYTKALLLFGINLLFSSCKRIETDSFTLCKEFYQLNKDKNFDNLLDVTIGSGRVKNVYDPMSNKYDLLFKTIGVYDAETTSYIDIPIFDREATLNEIDSIFKSIEQPARVFLAKKLKITPKTDLFSSYIVFVRNVLGQYYQLEMPKNYSSNNIVVDGNPKLGRFVKFNLNEKCICYYLFSPDSLDKFWSDRFRKMDNFDSKWYCEIIKEK